MIVINYIAYILLLVGGLNWGLVGIFDFNLVAWCCMGSKVAERIIYILVLIATITLLSHQQFGVDCTLQQEHRK